MRVLLAEFGVPAADPFSNSTDNGVPGGVPDLDVESLPDLVEIGVLGDVWLREKLSPPLILSTTSDKEL